MQQKFNSELSLEEVLRLNRKADSIAPRRVPRWPTDKDRVVLLEAIDKRRPKVILADKEYSINYYDDGKVWVKRADGTFGACGWFDPVNLRRELSV